MTNARDDVLCLGVLRVEERKRDEVGGSVSAGRPPFPGQSEKGRGVERTLDVVSSLPVSCGCTDNQIISTGLKLCCTGTAEMGEVKGRS